MKTSGRFDELSLVLTDALSADARSYRGWRRQRMCEIHTFNAETANRPVVASSTSLLLGVWAVDVSCER